jgi:YesN/AraC family two-component response regulator
MLNILMVDDEQDLKILISQRFRHEIRRGDYRFYFAHDGREALKILWENPSISLMITDLNMPRMNGIELTLKVSQDFPKVSKVMISAYGDKDSLQKATQVGISNYLTKPIQFDDLDHILVQYKERTEKENDDLS